MTPAKPEKVPGQEKAAPLVTPQTEPAESKTPYHLMFSPAAESFRQGLKSAAAGFPATIS